MSSHESVAMCFLSPRKTSKYRQRPFKLLWRWASHNYEARGRSSCPSPLTSIMPDPRSTTPPERPRTPASQPPTVSEHRAVTSTPCKSGGSGVLTGRSKKQTYVRLRLRLAADAHSGSNSIENIRRFYKYDLEHNSEDVSIEDFLLFLLGHALHSEDRVVVAKRLQELYSLALEMCNVDDGSNSGLSHLTDSNSGTKDDTEEGRHKAAWYSREFKQCLQK